MSDNESMFTSTHGKLYEMRDLYGNPNFEIISAIRDLDKLTRDNPAIIGIAPYGSTTRGYSTEDSDLDLRVLWDSSLVREGSPLTKLQEVHGFMKNKVNEIPPLREKDVSMIEQDLNPKLIIPDIHMDHPEIGIIVASHLAPLCRLITGDKVDKYRGLYSAELKKLPPDKRTEILGGILKYFEAEDRMGKYKTRSRTGMSDAEFENLVLRRKEMWNKRINEVFD